MMKVTLALLMFCFGSVAFASEVPNCYEEDNVIRGQFLIFLESDLGPSEQAKVIKSLGELEMSVVNSIGDELLVVERTALSVLKKSEEQEVLEGLEVLIGKSVLQVTCNTLVKLI